MDALIDLHVSLNFIMISSVVKPIREAREVVPSYSMVMSKLSSTQLWYAKLVPAAAA